VRMKLSAIRTIETRVRDFTDALLAT